MKGWMLAAACLVVFAIPAAAAERVAYYPDDRGNDLVRVTFSHPDKEITDAHLRSFVVTSGPSSQTGALGVKRTGVSSVHSRMLSELPAETLVDWSGVHVRIETMTGATCTALAWSAVGTVSKGEFAYWETYVASVITTVLSPIKGNPNMRILDPDGIVACYAEGNAKHAPQDCCVWAGDCTPMSMTVVVTGSKKTNGFAVTSWVSTAY